MPGHVREWLSPSTRWMLNESRAKQFHPCPESMRPENTATAPAPVLPETELMGQTLPVGSDAALGAGSGPAEILALKCFTPTGLFLTRVLVR